MYEIEKLRHDMEMDAKRFRWQAVAALSGAVGVAAALLGAGAAFAKLFL
jgi:hypothetical protein